MATATTSNDRKISKKPRRFQFGLRAMFLIVTLTAVGYAIYVQYYRKITVDLTYRVYSIKEEDFDPILLKKMPQFQKDPGNLNFMEFLLDKPQLDELMQKNSSLAGDDFRITGRDSGVEFHRPKQLGKIDYETFGQMRFRLDDGSTFLSLQLYIDRGIEDKEDRTDLKPIGTITYTDKFPSDGILFFNQLNDRSFLVYVFTAKEVD